MLKLIKQNFKTTWSCIIVAAPLVIFVTLLNMYYNYADRSATGVFDHIFSTITLFVTTCGFLSAWLYLAKKAYNMTKKNYLFDKDRNDDLINLFSSLYKGIGKLFLPVIGMLSIFIIINLLIFSLSAFIVTEIPQLYKYRHIVHIIGIILMLYLSVYWIPEIVYSERNAINALYNAIRKVLTNLFDSFIIFCWIIFLLFGIYLLHNITAFHPIFSFILLLLLYYVIVYIIMLLFTYYEQKFIKNDL